MSELAETLIAQLILDGYDPLGGRGRVDKHLAVLPRKTGISTGDVREVSDFFIYHEPHRFSELQAWWKKFAKLFDRQVELQLMKYPIEKLWLAYVLDQKQMTGRG